MKAILIACCGFFVLTSNGQSCDSCYLMQENKTVEMIRVSKKKRTFFNYITLTVMGVDKTAAGKDSRFRYESHNSMGIKSDVYYRARCTEGSLFIELAFLTRTLYETTGETIFMEYPNNMKVGDRFDDIVTEFYAKDDNGDPIHFPVSILKRQVVAKETVSLSIGSFEAYKITYKRKIRQYAYGQYVHADSEVTEWFVPGVGVVKIQADLDIIELSVLKN
jgi:hypothetical protein